MIQDIFANLYIIHAVGKELNVYYGMTPFTMSIRDLPIHMEQCYARHTLRMYRDNFQFTFKDAHINRIPTLQALSFTKGPIPKELLPFLLSFFGREYKKQLTSAASGVDFLQWLKNKPWEVIDVGNFLTFTINERPLPDSPITT